MTAVYFQMFSGTNLTQPFLSAEYISFSKVSSIFLCQMAITDPELLSVYRSVSLLHMKLWILIESSNLILIMFTIWKSGHTCRLTRDHLFWRDRKINKSSRSRASPHFRQGRSFYQGRGEQNEKSKDA